MDYDLDFVGPMPEGEDWPLKTGLLPPPYIAWVFTAVYFRGSKSRRVYSTTKETPERWARIFGLEPYCLIDKEERRMGDWGSAMVVMAPPPKPRPTKTLTRRELMQIKERCDSEDVMRLLWEVSLYRAAAVRAYELATTYNVHGVIDSALVAHTLSRLDSVVEFISRTARRKR